MSIIIALKSLVPCITLALLSIGASYAASKVLVVSQSGIVRTAEVQPIYLTAYIRVGLLRSDRHPSRA